jgi:hypothetical protein
VGILDRFRRDRGRAQEPPASSETSDSADVVTEDEVDGYAYDLVFTGFLTHADATEQVVDYFSDSAGPSPERIREIVDAAWARRVAELTAVDEAQPDAADRLARAFALLEDRGIVSRMDFTCCQTCGHAEIGDEVEEGVDARGYTFFHRQDSERIADGDVMLAFGSFGPHADLDAALFAAAEADEDTPERERARELAMSRSGELIAEEVVRTLRDTGLTVDWDGTAGTRIRVALPTWQRPLPA